MSPALSAPANSNDAGTARPDQPRQSPAVARGKYLVDAGNCVSCHTRAGAALFSGGVAFQTPFGTIYSTNITPHRETGIGSWSAADLRRAMHEGIAADGSRLFPVFPYPSYTKVSDEDVNAIYAYLRTLKAVSYVPPRNGKLLRQRWALPIWNSLFFTEGRFRTNAKQSAEWNRGAYLVQGLGHCGACHTPRNWFMAEDVDGALQGGLLMDRVAPGRIRLWSAVDLTSSKTGLAAWSVDELTKYLHTGFSRRAGTFGPMNEVIVNSLRKLTADDVHAMAVYLKALPSAKDYADASPSPAQVEQGQALYDDHCEECHSASGRGGMFSGPPLAGSAVVQAENPASLINIILHGPETPKEISFGSWETMKAYRDVLNDSEVAAVSNYVRGSWGNRGNVVDASQVEQQR